MSSTETIAWLALAMFGVCGSAVASGTETGTYCVNRVRLRIRAAASPIDRSARLLRGELAHPERLLATLLIANNIFNYLGAMGITELLAGAGFSDPAIIVLNAIVLTPLLFVFGESLPKELFRVEADRLTYALALPMAFARWALTIALILPVVRVSVRVLVRLVGVEAGTALTGPRERVVSLIKEGATHGVLSVAQLRLVDRALALGETTVGDEMVPWHQVKTISVEWSRERLMSFLSRESFSRFPVVDRRGRVVGILNQLDVYLEPDKSVLDLVSEPARLTPGGKVREAMLTLNESRAHAGIVERNGKPVGLVTNKDLVEPLTGELTEW